MSGTPQGEIKLTDRMCVQNKVVNGRKRHLLHLCKMAYLARKVDE